MNQDPKAGLLEDDKIPYTDRSGPSGIDYSRHFVQTIHATMCHKWYLDLVRDGSNERVIHP